jgi:hypothetical protein
MKKLTSKRYLAPFKLIYLLKILPVTRIKDPKAAILTLKLITKSRL